MKTIKKVFCVVLVLLSIGILCACGNESSGSSSYSDSDYSSKIDTSSAAIWAVKDYMSGTYLSIEQQIAAKYDLINFYSPDYTSETAKQSHDGSWSVTLKGKISGYTDEYNDNFETYKFEVTAEVSKYGEVSKIKVKRVADAGFYY